MTIIMRSALVAWGRKPPPELHHIEDDPWRGCRVVTWAEMMQARRERQASILHYKRHSAQSRACKVWVAYFDQDLFGGWQAFIENLGSRVWIDRDREWLIPKLMDLFPLTLLQADPWKIRQSMAWEQWKIEFARHCRRGTHDRKPRGCAFVWWDGHHELSLARAKG